MWSERLAACEMAVSTVWVRRSMTSVCSLSVMRSVYEVTVAVSTTSEERSTVDGWVSEALLQNKLRRPARSPAGEVVDVTVADPAGSWTS